MYFWCLFALESASRTISSDRSKADAKVVKDSDIHFTLHLSSRALVGRSRRFVFVSFKKSNLRFCSEEEIGDPVATKTS